jgi:GT2 family glycosyltransferase
MPRPDPNKIIACEWLSGASTYQKSILLKIRPDENLKRYSTNQDQDLSYRIFKKHPGSLLLTSRAKYWHDGSSAGRRSSKEKVYMWEVYDLYLFFKNIDQNLKSELLYLRSRIGRVAVMLILILRKPKARIAEIRYVIEAPFYCLKHMKEIRKGDLRFFNDTLK